MLSTYFKCISVQLYYVVCPEFSVIMVTLFLLAGNENQINTEQNRCYVNYDIYPPTRLAPVFDFENFDRTWSYLEKKRRKPGFCSESSPVYHKYG